MNYELHKIIAFTNLSFLRTLYELKLEKLPDGESKDKINNLIGRIDECTHLFRYMEKTMSWYAVNLSELNNLRVENWEKDQTIKKLEKRIEALMDGL